MVRLGHGFVFVKDLPRMVAFYEGALGMTARRTSHAGFVRMECPEGPGVALHELPAHIQPLVQVTTPPRWRDDTAYKLCFETDDLPGTRLAILEHGGLARDPWTWEGVTFCECADPEGNVVQIFAAGAPAA